MASLSQNCDRKEARVMSSDLSEISDKRQYPMSSVILLTPYKRRNINELLGKFSDNFSA